MSKNSAVQDGLFSNLLDAREQFARGQLESGFQLLLGVIDLLKTEETQRHLRQILDECSLRMREFGKDRMEYPILTIVTMESYEE